MRSDTSSDVDGVKITVIVESTLYGTAVEINDTHILEDSDNSYEEVVAGMLPMFRPRIIAAGAFLDLDEQA